MQENLTSFGARLKHERERRKISLDDISKSTRISTRFLRAIEEDHFDQLPGGIFNKGFIRAYARCVGIDEDQTIADYIAAIEPVPPPKKPENAELAAIAEIKAQQERSDDTGLPWGTLAILLVIIAIGIVFWGIRTRQIARSNDNAAAAIESPSSVPAATQQLPAQSPATPVEHATSQAPTPVSQPAATPKPVSDSRLRAGSPASSLAPGPVTKPAIETPAAKNFVVRIDAREDCWLSITTDGEVTTEITLPALSEKTIRARDSIIVKAGNAGAVDFQFNGTKLPPQGATGEVKTLTFTAHGLQSSTHKPSTPAEPPRNR